MTDVQDGMHVFVVQYNWQYDVACPTELRVFYSKEEADKFVESIDPNNMDCPDVTEIVLDEWF